MPASIIIRLIAAAALVVTSIALLISTGSRRPRRLTIVPGLAFVAPAVRRFRRLQIGQLLLATTIASATALDTSAEPEVSTLHLIARVSNAGAAVICLAVAAVLIARWGHAPFTLTPRGVQSFLRTVTWEQLDAMPSLPRRYPAARRGAQQFAGMDADPQFVGAAIEYYRRHPDARAMIGQPHEYERLNQAIAATVGM